MALDNVDFNSVGYEYYYPYYKGYDYAYGYGSSYRDDNPSSCRVSVWTGPEAR